MAERPKKYRTVKEQIEARNQEKAEQKERAEERRKQTKKYAKKQEVLANKQRISKRRHAKKKRKKVRAQRREAIRTETAEEKRIREAQEAEVRAKVSARNVEARRKNVIDQELARRELCRRRLIASTVRFNPDYLAGWVHKDICMRLEKFVEDLIAGKSPRLMLQMPPRHGKSQIASIDLPAWFLGNYPNKEVILCSYSASLALDFSRAVRERLRDKEYQVLFQKTRLDKDNQNAEGWKTTKKGGFLPAGVGGPITGKGAHLLIIDDPIKNAEEAESETTRESIKKWYTSTAYTRLAPGGGVLIIQCMTGDTPVMMADGSEKQLVDVQVGDEVATFQKGELRKAKVLKHASQGYDECLAITTTSGKVLKANGRHPFLVEIDGVLTWTRAKNLRSGQKIVTAKDSGANGKERPASLKDATSPPSVVGSAQATTTNGSGLLAIGHPQQNPTDMLTLRIDTDLIRKPTSSFSKNKTRDALAAAARQLAETIFQSFGMASPSTIATAVGQLEGFSATTATLPSPEFETPQLLSDWLITSDFTTETVTQIEPIGSHEVFDIQVEHTENFIANGCVSHNTRWHDSDLSGWLERQMQLGQGDEFEVVRYPAIALKDEKYRHKGEALHPQRYPEPDLKRIQRAVGPRTWAALYQQEPVLDDGAYFQRSMFQFYDPDKLPEELMYSSAWDLAIGQKEQNDWTVGMTWGRGYDDQFYVTDMRRGRWDSYEIVAEMCDQYEKFKPSIIGIEKGVISTSLGPYLEEEMSKRKLYGMYTEELTVGRRDKVARARTIQGLMRRGRVYFPDPVKAPWVNTVMNELLRFPHGVHDDIVDAMAWLGLMLAETPAPGPAFSNLPERKGWRDRIGPMLRGTRNKSPMGA